MNYRQFKGDQKKAVLEGNLRQHEEQHFLRSLDLLKWKNLEAVEGTDQTESSREIAGCERDIRRLESIIATVSGQLDALDAAPKAKAGTAPAQG